MSPKTITSCARCSTLLSSAVSKSSSWLSFLGLSCFETRQTQHIKKPDCAYCTPRPLEAFSEMEVRDIASSLLKACAKNGTETLMQDFARTPNPAVVKDVAGLFLELGGWVLDAGKGWDIGLNDHYAMDGEQDEVFVVGSADEEEEEDTIDIWLEQSKDLAEELGESSETKDNESSLEGFVIVDDDAAELAENHSIESVKENDDSVSVASQQILEETRKAFSLEDSKISADFAGELESTNKQCERSGE